MTRSSIDLLVQSIVAVLICAMATAAAIVTGQDGAPPTISGDALVGLYSAMLGYIFGVGNGVRVATREPGAGTPPE